MVTPSSPQGDSIDPATVLREQGKARRELGRRILNQCPHGKMRWQCRKCSPLTEGDLGDEYRTMDGQLQPWSQR